MMKLYFILICLGIIVSAKKHKHKNSNESITAEMSEIKLRYSDEDDMEYIPFVDTYLDLRGSMRKQFALEAAFVDHGRNMICSPVSALMPLGKLALGAEGRSERELLHALGLSNTEQIKSTFSHLITNMEYLPGVTLDVASRIYVGSDNRINKRFLKDTKEIFKSSCQKIDTSKPSKAASLINNWVSEKTRGKIEKLIHSNDISRDDSLILVNAIYFAGTWREQFKSTFMDDFYSPSGTRHIQMMSRQGTYKHYQCDDLNAQIVEIPYEGEQSAMIIVLPYSTNGLPGLLRALKLAPELLNEALEKMKKTDLILTMPKFKIESQLDISTLYKKVGLRSLFDDRKSKLTGIIEDDTVFISTAIQKAVIEVNEKGTEAAVASVIFAVGSSAIAPPAIEFNVNRPFYFIVSANKEQLFAGTIKDLN